MGEERFDQWAILELMGHRRLAGRVTEVEVAGASFLRIDVPNDCEGVAATWCPVHGNCTCPNRATEEANPECPLHAETSAHGPANIATQLYSPSAVYCITPTTEEIARKVARTSRPEPVTRWELEDHRARRPADPDPDFAEIDP